MTTTLVDLKTLTSLAKIAAAHGTSAQFMDMALQFAESAENHIAAWKWALRSRPLSHPAPTNPLSAAKTR